MRRIQQQNALLTFLGSSNVGPGYCTAHFKATWIVNACHVYFFALLKLKIFILLFIIYEFIIDEWHKI